MHQVAPTSNRTVCNEVQQQITSVCITSSNLPSLDSRCHRSVCLGRTWTLVSSLQLLFWAKWWQNKGTTHAESLIALGWPNMPWLWDLLAMSSHMPLSLPNLQSQQLNQIPHKDLVFVSFKKGFDKDISPAIISSWVKQTVFYAL